MEKKIIIELSFNAKEVAEKVGNVFDGDWCSTEEGVLRHYKENYPKFKREIGIVITRYFTTNCGDFFGTRKKIKNYEVLTDEDYADIYFELSKIVDKHKAEKKKRIEKEIEEREKELKALKEYLV